MKQREVEVGMRSRQNPKERRTLTKITYYEADNLSEARHMAKDIYGLTLVKVFNMFHRHRQADMARRAELIKAADPIKAMQRDIKGKLRNASEKELRAVQHFLKTSSKSPSAS